MTCYIHSVPGRLRVKIPSVKGHAEQAGAIQAALESLEGIESIRVNTVTGSIVVKYDPESFLREEILSTLEENGWMNQERIFKNDDSVFESSSKAGRALGRAVCGWAVGRALEGTGFSFLAAFI